MAVVVSTQARYVTDFQRDDTRPGDPTTPGTVRSRCDRRDGTQVVGR